MLLRFGHLQEKNIQWITTKIIQSLKKYTWKMDNTSLIPIHYNYTHMKKRKYTARKLMSLCIIRRSYSRGTSARLLTSPCAWVPQELPSQAGWRLLPHPHSPSQAHWSGSSPSPHPWTSLRSWSPGVKHLAILQMNMCPYTGNLWYMWVL